MPICPAKASSNCSKRRRSGADNRCFGEVSEVQSTGWEIGRPANGPLVEKINILPATTALLPFSIDSDAGAEESQERYALLLLDSYSVIDSYLSGAVNSTIKAKGKQYDHLNLSVGTGEAHSLGGFMQSAQSPPTSARLTPRAPLV